jgi:hypothetical protein
MKKTMQFLFAMSILMEGQSSFAGTTEIPSSISDKTTLNAPILSTIRGQQVVMVIVLDDVGKPIAGATVAAPCTGLSPMLTNSSGIAQFNLKGNCNCNGAEADITTSTCETRIVLSCGSDNPATCE